MLRVLGVAALGASLAACATTPDPSGNNSGVIGYQYHDGMHSNAVVSPSPQAIEAAKRGVWLWPPAENGRPG